jgi:hypothetical protein
MSYIKQMFESHPVNPSSDHAVGIECIIACYSCAEACNACADACLGEKEVAQMVECIRDCNDCADVCFRDRALDLALHPDGQDARRGAIAGLPRGMRRHLCEAWQNNGALPGLRRGLPTLRAGL